MLLIFNKTIQKTLENEQIRPAQLLHCEPNACHHTHIHRREPRHIDHVGAWWSGVGLVGKLPVQGYGHREILSRLLGQAVLGKNKTPTCA